MVKNFGLVKLLINRINLVKSLTKNNIYFFNIKIKMKTNKKNELST